MASSNKRANELKTGDHIEFKIIKDSDGNSYEKVFSEFFKMQDNLHSVEIFEPWIANIYQVDNLYQFCRMMIKFSNGIKKIQLITKKHGGFSQEERLKVIGNKLAKVDIVFDFKIDRDLHDRKVELSNGWVIKLGRGLNYFQSPNKNGYYPYGKYPYDQNLRKCLKTEIDFSHRNNYRSPSILGTVMNLNMVGFEKSKILLDKKLTDLLITICVFQKEQEWELIYRASEHYFGTQDFLRECGGKSKTLTIIRTTKDHVFGCYLDEAWRENSGCGTNAFLFSLLNHKNKPFKAKCLMPTHNAYYCDKHNICFGGSSGILISNKSNTNLESISNLNSHSKCYQVPNNTFQGGILAGKTHFQTNEIEVYRKKTFN